VDEVMAHGVGAPLKMRCEAIWEADHDDVDGGVFGGFWWI
jgi:hypothetical protein